MGGDLIMTRTEPTPTFAELSSAVTLLIAQFGRWNALREVIRQLFQYRGRPPDASSTLNAHLRKDIGLPPPPQNPVDRWRTPPL